MEGAAVQREGGHQGYEGEALSGQRERGTQVRMEMRGDTCT